MIAQPSGMFDDAKLMEESLIAMANRLVNNYHDAQDIVQESYAKLWVWLQQGNIYHVRLKTFLMHIIRNESISLIRRQRSAHLASTSHCHNVMESASESEPGDKRERDDELAILNDALNSLELHDRNLVRLYLEDFSCREISERTGAMVSSRAIGYRLQNIFAELRRQYIRRLGCD
jgi:RNA polymerase sigma factor (sigma-70 family)